MEINSTEDELLDLDISWLNEHEKLNNINKIEPKERMETIKINCIFVSKENNIEKIVTEYFVPEPLESNSGVVGGDGVDVCGHVCIHHHNVCEKVEYKGKYKLSDILFFHVDLEPYHIQEYAKNVITDESVGKFFKKLCIFDKSVIIPDSISVFHSLNCLYYIFKELDEKLPPSILKRGNRKTRKPHHKHCNFTKKVVFSV